MRSKYGNVRSGRYASKREASVAMQLAALERGGKIRNLREQVPFELIPGRGKIKGIKYIADFVYEELDGTLRVVDAKGFRTAIYILKKKMLKLLHDVDVIEV